MPGGSVNGRPFRESKDSYLWTGIPCGNPKRFKSQDVVRMEPTARTQSKPISGPVEAIETEGQRQLKSLLQKQMDTKLSLPEQMRKRKDFCKGANYKPAAEELVGVVPLEEYKTQEQSDAYLEDLRAFGLTDEEILYMLQQESEEHSVKKMKLSNPNYHEARLEAIQEKIAQKQAEWQKADTFSGVKQLSRHAMDLEKTLTKSSEESQFLHKTLVGEKDKSLTDSTDPMNQLPEILQSLTSRKQRRKHRHSHTKGYKSECTLECCTMGENSEVDNTDQNNQPMDSMATSAIATCAEKPPDYVERLKPEVVIETKKKAADKVCKSSSYTVDMDKHDDTVTYWGSHRELAHVDPIPEQSIKRFKLSEDDIRNMPRFENYTPGEPSKTLFVKNLSPKITEQDLASLFVGFQKNNESRIVFKLLTGRMKGQAFVTFPDVETATTAMSLVHGYDFKGKPIIIQFGKNQPS